MIIFNSRSSVGLVLRSTLVVVRVLLVDGAAVLVLLFAGAGAGAGAGAEAVDEEDANSRDKSMGVRASYST